MRVSIVSILLAGGMLALGACSTTVAPGDLALAERPECRLGSAAVPTARQTDDSRRDQRCLAKPVNRLDYYRDTNVRTPRAEPTRL